MARIRTQDIEIIQGESFSFAFPAITDEMQGRTARIKRVVAASHQIVFYGDVRTIIRNGAVIQIEQNGDANSNIQLVVAEDPTFDDDGPTSHGSYGDPETIVTFDNYAVPATMGANGFARRIHSMPVDLTGSTFLAQIRGASGALISEFDVSGDASGIPTAELPAEDTADLDFDRAVYDVKRTDGEGNVTFPYSGAVVLRRPVSAEE